MWEFLNAVFAATGIVGLVCIIEAVLLYFAVRAYQKKDKRVEDLQDILLDMSEKRKEDVIEEREKYEELSDDLHKSLDILIKVFKRRNGNDINGH